MMAIITWARRESYLTAFGEQIECSCIVRNELNELRGRAEVVYTMPGDHPYYPRRFPVGRWTVGDPVARTGRYLAPYFIPTDAWRFVDLWNIVDGKYKSSTGQLVKDIGYGLHYSESRTTLGCVKIHDKQALKTLVNQIIEAHEAKEEIIFEVTDNAST